MKSAALTSVFSKKPGNQSNACGIYTNALPFVPKITAGFPFKANTTYPDMKHSDFSHTPPSETHLILDIVRDSTYLLKDSLWIQAAPATSIRNGFFMFAPF